MNNKLHKFIIMLTFTLAIASVNVAYAIPKRLVPYKASISNFMLVMIGIVFFMGLIFIGLSIYNKYFVSKSIAEYKLRKYNLADSVDKDDAILNYVTKNKLR